MMSCFSRTREWFADDQTLSPLVANIKSLKDDGQGTSSVSNQMASGICLSHLETPRALYSGKHTQTAIGMGELAGM